MNVDSTIIRGDAKRRALIVHSTEDDLGLRIAEYIQKAVDTDVGLQIACASTYSALIGILEKAAPFKVFVLIAHGDKDTHAAWLFADVDVDGNELSLGAAEQATLRGYLQDKVCVFGVCYFGTDTLADLLVGHDGAVFALASHPQNTLTGYDVAKAAVSLINATQAVKPYPVTIDVLVQHCVTQIDAQVLQKMVSFSAFDA